MLVALKCGANYQKLKTSAVLSIADSRLHFPFRSYILFFLLRLIKCFLINLFAKWLNASWLVVLQDTNQPNKMMPRYYSDCHVFCCSVADLSSAYDRAQPGSYGRTEGARYHI